MSPNGFKWVHLDPNESKWIHMNPRGSKWVHMDPKYFKWITLTLILTLICGFLYIFCFSGSVWTHLCIFLSIWSIWTLSNTCISLHKAYRKYQLIHINIHGFRSVRHNIYIIFVKSKRTTTKPRALYRRNQYPYVSKREKSVFTKSMT